MLATYACLGSLGIGSRATHVPESLSVKVHAAIVFICHVIAHDGLDVFDYFSHVLADPGHCIWSSAAQGIHVFKKLSFVSGCVLPAAQNTVTHITSLVLLELSQVLLTM